MLDMHKDNDHNLKISYKVNPSISNSLQTYTTVVYTYDFRMPNDCFKRTEIHS